MKLSTSSYLIPLAYAASFSGLMTLISTPTNLVISQVLSEKGFAKLEFFTITPLGLITFSTGASTVFTSRPQKAAPAQKPEKIHHRTANISGTIDRRVPFGSGFTAFPFRIIRRW